MEVCSDCQCQGYAEFKLERAFLYCGIDLKSVNVRLLKQFSD